MCDAAISYDSLSHKARPMIIAKQQILFIYLRFIDKTLNLC